MFGDPAYPSAPPPPPDEAVRPMSFIAAAAWVAGAQIAFLWLAVLTVAIREAASRDFFSHVICQLVAYSGVLFALLRLHGPHARVRDFVALRPTHTGFYALALALGAAAALPASYLLGLIERVVPPPEASREFVEIFLRAGRAQRWLMAVGTVAIGPVVEELLFRGGIFGPLLRRHRPGAVVIVTGCYFALVHPEPRHLVPVMLVGVLLGYVRWQSGSLVPAVLAHAGFNAVPIVGLMTESGAPDPKEPPSPLPLGWALGAAALCAALVWAARELGRHSRRAQHARAQDG
jgi:membrane protease YdiL (CAAX protease family)